MSRGKRVEYLSLAGLRLDGRKPGDPRELEVELGVYKEGADGSACVTAGGTRVVAAVYGPREVEGVRDENCAINVNAQYAAFAHSSGHRRTNDMKATETQQCIQNVLENTVMTHLFPSSALHVHLEVLSDDGSVIPTLINACSLALASAGVPIYDLVTAVSASYLQKAHLIDITDQESKASGPTLNLAVLPSSGNIAMLTMDNQVELDDLETMLAEATKGCQRVHAQLKTIAVQCATQQFKTRAKEK